jgi:hypothetical protein
MNCVCGYKHQSGMDDNRKYQENLIGDKPFMPISGVILEANDNQSFYDDPKRITLYICPKCSSVIAGRDGENLNFWSS